MRKKLRVIQINGFRGICMALGIVSCLIAGFVVFPGMVAMNIWNFISVKTALIPSLGLIQGILLWGITVVTYMITKKNSLIVSFKAPTELTEEEIDEVMKRVNFEAATQRMMDDVIKSGMDSRRPFNTMPQANIESQEEIETTNKNIDN